MTEASPSRSTGDVTQNQFQRRRMCEPQDPPFTTDEHSLVDVRDMIVVHTAMLREFRLAPASVARIPAGAHRAARRVDAHLGLLCELLHYHHAGEDELLWPPLRSLLNAHGQACLDAAEAQHSGIDAALRVVGLARHRWIEVGDNTTRDELIAALQYLHWLLVLHLDTEERDLLPLAAAHLTPGQWAAVGEAGAVSIPKSKMLLVFGMLAYEGDPDILTAMLHPAPPPARAIVPLLAPRIYARFAKRIHGTPRPRPIRLD